METCGKSSHKTDQIEKWQVGMRKRCREQMDEIAS